MLPQESTGALAGVTVLELGARIGVSVAGSLLAQLGASVVFVEAVTGGGFAQPKWQFRDQYAAGKQSLAVDVSRQDDLELLARLAAGSDMVLQSTDVDILAYGAAPLSQRCDAILCDLTAFGSSGPLRGVPATDAQVQALAGVMDATGCADGPPMAIPLPLIEQLAGVYAAGGLLAALRERRRDAGRKPAVEVALYDVAFSAMTSFLAPALSGAGDAGPSRVGNRHTMAAPWNVYRARDGWLLLCAGNDDQWERICELTGDRCAQLARNADRVARADEVDALVQAWVGRCSIAQCVQRLSGLGIPCGPVALIDGFPREANLAHRHMAFEATGADGRPLHLPGSPLRMSQSPGAPLLRVPAPDADRARLVETLGQRSARVGRQPQSPPRQPLAGLRVVEVGHYTTAPVATRLLAALGADVIKVEPLEGEAVRRWPPARNGQGIFFTFQNADKRSLALDMNSDDGAATLKRLVASADVLVENLRPGALGRKGFGPQDMLALNPRLVYCSISGFGADSLYQGRPAFDTVIQAMSGMMAINRVGDMPLKTGPSLADVLGAAVGVVSVLAALEHRQRTGAGQAIDLSMQDVCAWATQAGWNRAAAGAGAGIVLRCSDGYVLADGRGAEVAGLDRAQAVATLAKAGITAVAVLATREVVLEPQTQVRGLWNLVASQGAQYPVLASPIRFAGQAGAVPRPGPALGRDNVQILQELT